MKFSEAWLREFVNPDIDTALLHDHLDIDRVRCYTMLLQERFRVLPDFF